MSTAEHVRPPFPAPLYEVALMGGYYGADGWVGALLGEVKQCEWRDQSVAAERASLWQFYKNQVRSESSTLMLRTITTSVQNVQL